VTGRVFFEEVIRENLDVVRPDQVQLIFDRRVTRQTPGRSCPAPQTIECTSPNGANATVNETATDGWSVGSVGCSPGSGTFRCRCPPALAPTSSGAGDDSWRRGRRRG
jgi:hypothetical protein